MNGDVQQDEEWDQRKDQAKASEEARIQRRDNEKRWKVKRKWIHHNKYYINYKSTNLSERILWEIEFIHLR